MTEQANQAAQDPVVADGSVGQMDQQVPPVIPAQADVAAETPVVPDPRDARITELEATVVRLNTEKQTAQDQHSQALATVRKQFTDQLAAAAGTYAAFALLHNPEIPHQLVSGKTIEEVQTSLVKAQDIVNQVKAQITAQAAAQVPGGAPVRSGPDIESMTPLDKIKYSLATRKK